MTQQKLRLNPRLTTALCSPLLWLLTAGLPASAEDNWTADFNGFVLGVGFHF